MNNNEFKKIYSFNERKKESERVLLKYPDRIPVICEKNKNCNNIEDIDKKKYLIQYDITIGQFIFILRKRLKLNEYNALFLTVNGVMPSSSEYISLLYEKYKDNDNFIYFNYSSENTFGT